MSLREDLAVALDVLEDGCAEDMTVAWSLEILKAVSPPSHFYSWDGTAGPMFAFRVKSYSSSYSGTFSSSDSSSSSGSNEPKSKIPEHPWSRSGSKGRYGRSYSVTYRRPLWWENE